MIAVSVADLLQVVVVSLLAGLGVTVVFAVAIAGAVHARDAHRDDRGAARTAWSGVSLLALLGVAAAVLAGLWVLSS